MTKKSVDRATLNTARGRRARRRPSEELAERTRQLVLVDEVFYAIEISPRRALAPGRGGYAMGTAR